MVRRHFTGAHACHLDVAAADSQSRGVAGGGAGPAQGARRESVPRGRDQPHGTGVDSAQSSHGDGLCRHGFGVAAESGAAEGAGPRFTSGGEFVTTEASHKMASARKPIPSLRWWIGTRRGLTLSVIGYSTISMLTSLATGFYSFATFRFLLGAGESANWPAATKAASEWFPKRERALATALFDSGSSIGGAVAPFIVLWIYFRWGWRPAFMIPGTLGFLWLIAWRWLYYPPEEHPRIGPDELAMIVGDKRESESPQDGKARPRWRDLLRLP